MMEKLLILCADSEFAQELSQAVNKLEERVGNNKDIDDLKKAIDNTLKLCQNVTH